MLVLLILILTRGHDAFLLEEPEFDDAMRGFINSVSLEANI